MRRRRAFWSRWICCGLVGGMFAVSAAPLRAEDVRIGILAHRGVTECLKTWTPTAEYLSQQLGRQFRIQPLKFDEIPVFLKERKIDFFLVNSSMYADLRNQFGGEVIASMINTRNGKPLDTFGGVLFVRADSPIKTLQDIRGKKFMCVKKSSFGGYQMALRLLRQNGIDPERDCSAFREGGTHDGVVEMVKAGTMDVGTVRSDTLESMAAAGRIRMEEFRILNRQNDSFPFVHSTPLYPEWPLARAAATNKELARKVAAVLVSMPADSQAIKAAEIHSWGYPQDYAEVEKCLKELRFGSFGGK